jgi:hypothetical protein
MFAAGVAWRKTIWRRAVSGWFCAVERRLADAFGGPHGTAESVPILAMERHIVAPFGHRPAWSRRRSGGV